MPPGVRPLASSSSTVWELRQPRGQLGGRALSSCVEFSVVPRFHFVLPRNFETSDPNDPRLFESEASYLDRHGLLTDDESGNCPTTRTPTLIRPTEHDHPADAA